MVSGEIVKTWKNIIKKENEIDLEKSFKINL